MIERHSSVFDHLFTMHVKKFVYLVGSCSTHVTFCRNLIFTIIMLCEQIILVFKKYTLTKSIHLPFHKCLSSYSSPEYRAIFIGSDHFSLPSLIALTKFLKPENVSVVVSSENNIVGKWAKKNKSTIFLWNDFKTLDFEQKNVFNYDIGVVASFGYLIPSRIINRFPLGILNVHASLLPRWRGASPINHSIMYGDTETGISIMKIMPHRFDVGPVLLRKAIKLDDHIRAPDLLKILADLGAVGLVEVMKDLSNCLKNPIHQDDSLATLAPKLTPEMADVDWSSKTAIEVYRLFRGLYGSLKLKTTFNERRVDLDEIELPVITSNTTECGYMQGLPSNGPPGQICCLKNEIYVRCATSSGVATWIKVNKIKIGIKWMSAKDFRNGYLSKGKISHGISRFYLSKSVVEDKHVLRIS